MVLNFVKNIIRKYNLIIFKFGIERFIRNKIIRELMIKLSKCLMFVMILLSN